MVTLEVPPPKNPLPQRCLFCDFDGKLSREDYFPKWMAALFPKAANDKVRAKHAIVRFRREGENTIGLYAGNGRQARQGRDVDQTLRVLCEPCNNVRLGLLQEKAKPILTPLIHGVWMPRSRSDLDTIASWAVMTTMVFEAADPPTISIPRHHREQFRETHQPPPGTLVFMARTSSKRDVNFNHRALTIHAPDGSTTPAQCTTWQFGKLILQVLTSANERPLVSQIVHGEEYGLLPIWPANPLASRVQIREYTEAGVIDLLIKTFAPTNLKQIPSKDTPMRHDPAEYS